MKKLLLILIGLCGSLSGIHAQQQLLKVSANKRYFVTANNKPFFWLGDTGWLLFVKCNRDAAIQYLDDRKAKGFNVIQVMLVHDINLGVNAYGDSALQNKDVSKPNVTAGHSFTDSIAYDFWDHVDFIVNEAGKRGMYMAMVPLWGGNVKHVSVAQGMGYARFLANRYKNRMNIIWLNGGDIRGTDGLEVWNAIGTTLRAVDKIHLITFHPRGRNSSSTWFHNKHWLDFNMFQSGHRSYAQDTSANETLHYGEDNWRYVNVDYNLKPIRPTLDGEPSYEGIPYGLHLETEPYWQDFEIRRYAYWSVFAGGSGFTYGHNSVMQFYTPGDSGVSFFPKIEWRAALAAPGAAQMQYLKKLMLRKSYFDRIPDQSLVANNGEKYDRVLATSGKAYAMFYVYNGRTFNVDARKLKFRPSKAAWFNPRNGETKSMSPSRKLTVSSFDPPGERKDGNDWVLLLEK